MAHMKSALKVAVGVFATIGVLYTAFFIYATVFLSDCILTIPAQAISPTGEYTAVFQQTTCKNMDKSRSEVLLGKRGVKERYVVLEIRGTSRVDLSWGQPDELVVFYPNSAVVKKLGTDGTWPRVTYRPTE